MRNGKFLCILAAAFFLCLFRRGEAATTRTTPPRIMKHPESVKASFCSGTFVLIQQPGSDWGLNVGGRQKRISRPEIPPQAQPENFTEFANG